MSNISPLFVMAAVVLIGCDSDALNVTVSPQTPDAGPDSTDSDPFFAETYAGLDQHQQSAAAVATESPLLGSVFATGLSPQNQQVRRFVQHVSDQGISLLYDDQLQMWRTAEPVADEYYPAFHLAGFPSDATPEQMQQSLLAVNLAYGLNSAAHLAMSRPQPVQLPSDPPGTPTDAVVVATSQQFRSVQSELESVFLSYRP